MDNIQESAVTNLEREETVIQPAQTQQIPARQVKKFFAFAPEFNWNLEGFSEEDALKNFSQLANEDLQTDISKENQSKLYIAESSVKSSGLTKTNVYILRGEDNAYGKIEIIRRYSDFYELREALVRRWPGIFIPPIPERGNVGTNEKQIAKNKLQILNNFLRRLINKEAVFTGEEFQAFIKSGDNDVTKNLQKLKARTIDELLTIYKANWLNHFQQKSEEEIEEEEKKIKRFEEYFTDVKVDLVRHKDAMKRLAELRVKLNVQRYHILLKTLPEYENTCLKWFNGPQKEVEENEQNMVEREKMGSIYSDSKYQDLLEAYKEEVFEGKFEQGWVMYEMFKFELKEIDSILQAVTQYKYLKNEKKYYMRNVENNKQQIEDINNKKISFKIFFLSGTEDDKKSHLANETMELETKLRVVEELWSGLTQLMIAEIEDFQAERCEHYKKSMVDSFKKEALMMSKLFNLYVEAQRL